jgi:DNA-binding transcriptional ArsR family regulator
MGKGQDPDGERVTAVLRAAAVPERLRILRAVAAEGPLSPSGYVEAHRDATTLRETAYHFRHLRDGHALVLHEVRATGGTAQHFYVVSETGRALLRALPALERAAKADVGA